MTHKAARRPCQSFPCFSTSHPMAMPCACVRACVSERDRNRDRAEREGREETREQNSGTWRKRSPSPVPGAVVCRNQHPGRRQGPRHTAPAAGAPLGTGWLHFGQQPRHHARRCHNERQTSAYLSSGELLVYSLIHRYYPKWATEGTKKERVPIKCDESAHYAAINVCPTHPAPRG